MSFGGRGFRLLSKLLKEYGADAAQDQMSAIWHDLDPLAKRINKASVHSTRGLRAKVLVALWEALPWGSGDREMCIGWDEPAQTLLCATAEVAGLRSMMNHMEGRLSALANEEAGA